MVTRREIGVLKVEESIPDARLIASASSADRWHLGVVLWRVRTALPAKFSVVGKDGHAKRRFVRQGEVP